MTQQENERLKNFIDWYSSTYSNYCQFSELILQKIITALNERDFVIAYSSSRAKDIDSLIKKCKKTICDKESGEFVLKYDNPQKQITDLAGVRIVTYLKTDIDAIKKIIERLFTIDVDNSGDKIDAMSDNEIGYLSMHYIVSLKEITFETSKFKDYKCEIQIRTILQDAWAQIFHDRQYKGILNDVCYSYEIKRKTSLIAGALELIDNQITDLVSEYDSLNDVLLDGVIIVRDKYSCLIL